MILLWAMGLQVVELVTVELLVFVSQAVELPVAALPLAD
jgi:hypothetical protein